jgi:hypothetical protein
MSKPLDTRVVEYAYVASMSLVPNLGYEGGFKHFVRVAYEIKDTNKVLLTTMDRLHLVDSTGADSVATYTAAVAAALPGFIAADKLELSGYSS